jgi:hypothetical protein
MSGSRGGDAFHLPGDDSDSESSVSSSHASKNSDFCRKRPQRTPQKFLSKPGSLWPGSLRNHHHENGSAGPTYSDPRNKDCPFPKWAHWTAHSKHLDLKIMKLITRLGFFCNLKGLFNELLIPMMQIKFKSRCSSRARGQLRRGYQKFHNFCSYF